MAEAGRQVILAAEWRYHPHHWQGSGQSAHCRLERHLLTWQVRSQRYTLSIQDILSVSPEAPQPEQFRMIIHACPSTRSTPWTPKRRQLTTYRFACQSIDQQAEWQRGLTTLMQQHRQAPVPDHLLIILNPASGQGRAQRHWTQVAPLFQHSHIQTTIIQPTHPAELHHFLTQTFQPQAYDGLVIVGGDGTVHTILNALQAHPDAQAALNLPLGVIPAGTGNGLCQSLLHASGEPFDPLSAAFLITQGHPQPIDLLQIHHQHQRRVGILSLSWGLISDIDLESEPWRWLGALRNDVYALWCILRFRAYAGQLDIQTEVDGPWHSHTGSWLGIWVLNVPWATQTVNAAPQAQLTDGYMDVLWVQTGVTRWQVLWTFFNLSQGKVLSSRYIQAVKATRLRLIPSQNQGKLALDGEQMVSDALEIGVQSGQGRVFRL